MERERLPNLTFEVRDVKNLSFNGEFDVVLSDATLHWDKRSIFKHRYKFE